MDTATLIENAATLIEHCREDGAASDDFIPDEVAICFPDEESLVLFVKEAIQDYGLENFNSVEKDHMSRLDRIGEGFDVRFEFLRLPGRSWRFECMFVYPGGIAPLHERALRENGGEPVIIHISFKLHNVDEYGQTVREWPTRHAWSRKAEYSNSYGIFSYWSVNGGPYWKPRVNLRDT